MSDQAIHTSTTTEKPNNHRRRWVAGKARKSSGQGRPILFSGPMIRAVIDGHKVQTRRLVQYMLPAPTPGTPRPADQKHEAPYFDAICPGGNKTAANPRGMTDQWCWWQIDDRMCMPIILCPYGQPGDHLWVRETFSYDQRSPRQPGTAVWYWADGNPRSGDWTRPKPSIHMPRWASRLLLEVRAIRCERLQDMSQEDAIAEGFPSRDAFSAYWVHLHGGRGLSGQSYGLGDRVQAGMAGRIFRGTFRDREGANTMIGPGENAAGRALHKRVTGLRLNTLWDGMSDAERAPWIADAMLIVRAHNGAESTAAIATLTKEIERVEAKVLRWVGYQTGARR